MPEKLEGLATTNLGVYISSDNGETGKLSLELRFVLDMNHRECVMFVVQILHVISLHSMTE